MKKKILMGLVVIATVVGIGFAADKLCSKCGKYYSGAYCPNCSSYWECVRDDAKTGAEIGGYVGGAIGAASAITNPASAAAKATGVDTTIGAGIGGGIGVITGLIECAD